MQIYREKSRDTDRDSACGRKKENDILKSNTRTNKNNIRSQSYLLDAARHPIVGGQIEHVAKHEAQTRAARKRKREIIKRQNKIVDFFSKMFEKRKTKKKHEVSCPKYRVLFCLNKKKDYLNGDYTELSCYAIL